MWSEKFGIPQRELTMKKKNFPLKIVTTQTQFFAAKQAQQRCVDQSPFEYVRKQVR